MLGDLVAVGWPKEQGPQDQHVERALQKIGFGVLGRHDGRHSTLGKVDALSVQKLAICPATTCQTQVRRGTPCCSSMATSTSPVLVGVRGSECGGAARRYCTGQEVWYPSSRAARNGQ